MTGTSIAIDPAQLPQSWRDIVSPPPLVFGRVEQLLADLPDGDLDTDALALLVERFALEQHLWQPMTVADPHRRQYRLAYEDDRLDLWVLSWMPGQRTGFHDHGTSGVALTAVQGSVVERQLALGDTTLERILVPGSVEVGDAGYIHSVGHHVGVPAVTIHAYSPPLANVGQYRFNEDGGLRREPQHGRQELMDTSSEHLHAVPPASV